MRLRHLALTIISLTATDLPAQFFRSMGTDTRRVARATWLGRSGDQSVAIEYGQPKWRAEYEAVATRREAGPMMLGNGTLTTLCSDVDLTFGAQRVPRGRWYLSAWRDEQQAWSLAVFSAERVDTSGRGATTILSTEPEFRVPLRLTRAPESMEQFEITLADGKPAPTGLVLTLAWGPYRLGTELQPAFDARKPDGAPDFALTAAGQGTKTESGLTFEVLRAGAGASPGERDLVRAHYVGWLTDGTMFDSTYVHGQPEPLRAQWVVKGLAEGLQMMQPGGTYRVTIPPELGYGERGAGSRVPPHATLVYVVTVVAVEPR